MILYTESGAVLRWLVNDALADLVFDDLIRARKVVCSRRPEGALRRLGSPRRSSVRR